MPSTLTWIDHDTEARDRMQRVLALFEERDTRDELGLGPIRDSFSDLLFPGTSTIQTRLRYMLIVPWVYRYLEDEGVTSRRIADRGRELELDISESVLAAGEDTAGVFGATAGRKLKRLPSEVYWSGLEVWDIRRFRGTRGRYHAALDLIRERRARAACEEEGAAPDPSLTTWDPSLPPPPPDFPVLRTLRLRRVEAEYLQDRVTRSCPGELPRLPVPAPHASGGHPSVGASAGLRRPGSDSPPARTGPPLLRRHPRGVPGWNGSWRVRVP